MYFHAHRAFWWGLLVAWISSVLPISPVPAFPPEMASVPGGSFVMGNSGRGDDATYGVSDELPTHTVALSAYEIGKYEVTNGEFCEVLNWALDQDILAFSYSGVAGVWQPWSVSLKAEDSDSVDHLFLDEDLLNLGEMSQIAFTEDRFLHKTRSDSGTSRSLENHPMIEVSWYGAVAFCNFSSLMAGYTPAYDLDTWRLVDYDENEPGLQFTNGYRLPTEAEWERAAAWDGMKHWVYGFTSSRLAGTQVCNYTPEAKTGHRKGVGVNPLGFVENDFLGFTSPVGWFDGRNISPNGNVQTADGRSPIGCYDMSGNVWEWCQDWYGERAYQDAKTENPMGPVRGIYRSVRGGSCLNPKSESRSARRGWSEARLTMHFIGFRVARTPSGP